MKTLLLLLALLMVQSLLGQNEPRPITPVEEVIDFPDVEPQFPGGQLKMMEFLSKNIVYPQEAKDEGIYGKVYLRFIVEKDGSITNVEAVKGPNDLLNKEAIRVTQSMPKWTPGSQNGKPVKVRYILPINFSLN